MKLQVAYWRRFVPALQRLRQRIANGELGALYFLACYQWDGEPPPAQFDAGSGGIFVDMGVHEFDQIRWLSGQEFSRLDVAVASVSAAPESAQVLCTLSGGSTALVSLGRRFPLGDVCRVEAFGTRDAEDCRFLWPPDGERVFLDALRRQAEAFAAWVRGGEATGATAADAVAALAAAEQGRGANMTVQLGINPITWTNDDMPELGGDIPLETCLAETREAGYSGTELGGKFPRTAAVLGPILTRYHLKLVSGWFDGRILERDVAAEFAAIEPHLTLLRDLGCKVVVYADTSGRQGFPPISQRPKLADGDWPAYGRKVTELAERMAAFGVRMAFHHHMGTIVESEADIDRLMSSTGEAAGLLFDSGHCLFAGGDPAALLARHIAARGACALQGRATRRAGSGDRGRHDVHGRGAARRVHRSRRRVHRVHAAAAAIV